jgi:hypothetical protein
MSFCVGKIFYLEVIAILHCKIPLMSGKNTGNWNIASKFTFKKTIHNSQNSKNALRRMIDIGERLS